MTPRVLFERVQADDPAALEVLFAELQRRFAAHLRLRLPEHAEDALHEAYLAMQTAIKEQRFAPPTIWAYAHGVVNNLIRRGWRERSQKVVSIDSGRREEEPDSRAA